jgi:hypothetical protein
VRRAGLVLLALALLSACGRAEGLRDTERALEGAGYGDVEITVRSGGGLDVVRVDATGIDPERATRIVWTTLPVRFDQLVVTLGPSGPLSGRTGPSGPLSGRTGPSGPRSGRTGSEVSTASYESLAGRFGPRDSGLDRKQVSDQVVRDGLDLMLLLSLAALLSVAGVVALGLLVVRTARRNRAAPEDQAEGPISGLGADSPTAGDSAAAAEGPEAIPS